MATPSSSTTTPSPQPRYMQPAQVGHAPSPLAVAISPSEKEEREKAIQKFLASAEIAQLTRGLRTRLSYASYKATHNVAHNTLPDLEAQAQSSNAHAKLSAPRIPGNYYNNPATQGNSAMTPSASSRASQRKGPMAPPPPVTASATQSLFASILAPPPAKRARTIHNPQDPPVPASTKPSITSSPVRKSAKGRESERGQGKSKTRSKGAKDKGKGKAKSARDTEEGAADIDIDMNAAATLTNLLLHQRQQSQSATASSPRSSVSAGSDSGSASTHGYQQFAQSSTRTVTDAAAVSPLPARPVTPLAENMSRSDGRTTPKPPSGALLRSGTSGTPHPPTDTEAADLMLYLATSPSPVRPSPLHDKATSRSASKVHVLASGFKGRALFPSVLGDGGRMPSRPLRRDDTGSFASTATVVDDDTTGGVGTVAERMGKLSTSPLPTSGKGLSVTASGHPFVPMEPTVTPPTPTEPASSQPQLLPAPPSPSQAQSQRAASTERLLFPGPAPGYAPPDGNIVAASPALFNIHEYINASPSPAMSAPMGPSEYEVGRLLFEPHHGSNGAVSHGETPASSQGGLAAGIDLMKDPQR